MQGEEKEFRWLKSGAKVQGRQKEETWIQDFYRTSAMRVYSQSGMIKVPCKALLDCQFTDHEQVGCPCLESF